MQLSIKILDPSSTDLTDIGHFLFLGTEELRDFKAQIIDLDTNESPYYIPLSSSVSITFPTSISVLGIINSNRSIVTVILDDVLLANMISGDLSITITEPSTLRTAFLGNCIRRLLPLESTTIVPPISITGEVLSSTDDTIPGVLDDEIVAGPGLIKTIIDTPGQGKALQLSSSIQTLTVTNTSGFTINQYKAVRLTGDNEVSYADNTSEINSRVVGITNVQILNTEDGSVTTDGTMDAVLFGVSSGDTLYLGSTNGEIVNTPPTASGVVVHKIGKYNSGKIHVNLELVCIN